MTERKERRFKTVEQIFKTYIPDYQDPSQQEQSGAEIGERIAGKLVGQLGESIRGRDQERPGETRLD